MKKVALVIALFAAIGFASHMFAEPASAFLFGGGGSGCGSSYGSKGLFGGGGGPFAGLFGGGKSCAPSYGAAYYGCCPVAPCKVSKKKAKAGAAAAPAPKAKKEKKK
jgi:hypothetical protein